MSDNGKYSGVIWLFICLSVSSFLIGIFCYFEHKKVRTDKINLLLAERSELIRLGTPREKVKGILSDIPDLTSGNWRALEDAGRDIDEFRVSTPLLFGAKNWVLVIYSKSDEVVALGFRTEDSDYETPIGAPQDRFTSSVEVIWQSKMSLVPNNPDNQQPKNQKTQGRENGDSDGLRFGQ